MDRKTIRHWEKNHTKHGFHHSMVCGKYVIWSPRWRTTKRARVPTKKSNVMCFFQHMISSYEGHVNNAGSVWRSSAKQGSQHYFHKIKYFSVWRHRQKLSITERRLERRGSITDGRTKQARSHVEEKNWRKREFNFSCRSCKTESKISSCRTGNVVWKSA